MALSAQQVLNTFRKADFVRHHICVSLNWKILDMGDHLLEVKSLAGLLVETDTYQAKFQYQ